MEDSILDKARALMPTARSTKKRISSARAALARRQKQLGDVKKNLAKLVRDVEKLAAKYASEVSASAEPARAKPAKARGRKKPKTPKTPKTVVRKGARKARKPAARAR